ncbi:hypothetical protein O6H91_17G075800 [Diphasiastrum complanatum]|uniref:Uncharacterized protein n=1 Tax=Diphasiastrum complanatum TaxID=34168 RepID=A0ACC2B823_DIPCM|nr:hypothetical protein O6H91_17G075800 [Diphasiastrum complanatum]
MALQQGGFWSPSRVRQAIMLLVIGVALYLLAPPLYWQIVQGSADTAAACVPCLCHCATNSDAADDLISVLRNISSAGCATDNPDVRQELGKGNEELLAEELKLQAAVSEESQLRADAVLLDAKKLASHYQKEAEKCNIAMETSEEAREKAEAELQVQKKLSAEWEYRARLLGWKDKEDALDDSGSTFNKRDKDQSVAVTGKNGSASSRSSRRNNKQRTAR